MAAPTTEFLEIPTSTLASAMTDKSTRDITKAGWSAVDVGTPLDFGSVSVSGGDADSDLKAVCFQVTAFNGNTNVTNMRFWVTTDLNVTGPPGTPSDVNYVTVVLEGAGNWVQNPVIGDYTWASTPTSEPGSANVNNALGAASLTNDDITEAIVLYIHVNQGQPLGTYQGTAGSTDLQFNLKFDFS